MDAEAPRTTALGYQPALDGMRAFAIVLVVMFHYPWANPYFGGNPVHGGFLGVDVFFVLSGFLITTLLLQERTRTGKVSLSAFYARRALRLFPAFAVLFLIGVGAHLLWSASDSARPSTQGLVGMLFYLANWIQIWKRGSLGGVFGHTWSLAIEEQFYLVFPLVLIGLMRARLRGLRLAAALAGLMAISAGWRSYFWNTHSTHDTFIDFFARLTGRPPTGDTNPFHFWDRWYFGTDTRVDTLLAGCVAAALLVHFWPRITDRVARVLAWVAVAAVVGAGWLIAHSYILLSGWLPTWGVLVLEVLVAIAVVGIVVAPRAPLARFFALAPLVWIGRRSYAIYLFHPLVFHLLGRDRVHLAPPLSFVFQMLVVGVAAELSWRLVEQPFLRRKRRFAS